MLTLNEYQEKSKATAIYPDAGKCTSAELAYLSLGILGEVVEWEEAHSPAEMGGVMWYAARLSELTEYKLDWYWAKKHLAEGHEPNLANDVKKAIRDGKEVKYAIKEYLLWILNRFYKHLDLGPTESNIAIRTIAQDNLTSLLSRQVRGVLQGDGDNR